MAKLSHVDTCLPDYFNGHHKPVLQIAVHNGMTGPEVTEALIDEYNTVWDHLNYGDNAWPDWNDEELRKACTEILIDPDSDNVFPELDKLEEGEELEYMCDTVYAHFVWED
jgi:hypothetical protein